jgi:hypothetical protein
MDGAKDKSSAPAKLICTPDGTQRWYLDGQLHRDDGPAYEGIDGTKMWFRQNKMHREDGPALIQPDGREEFWLNGRNFSEKEFAHMQKRHAQEKRDAERAAQAQKQAAVDDAHQKRADEMHDKLRRTAKNLKPPKLGKP